MADSSSPVPGPEPGDAGESKPDSPHDPLRESVIAALIGAMETLLRGSKEPSESLRNSTASAAERPVLLFGEIGDHQGPLERLLRSLKWSAFFAEARMAVLLFCLIAALLCLLFIPWSGLSGMFKGESGSVSTKLPNLQSNSELGRDQCCAPGMVPGADGYCCKVDPALPPDSDLRQALDDTALQRALAERAKAQLDALKQEQTLKDAQANARRGSNPTPSPIGKKLVEALAKIPPPFWAASLGIPALLIMFTILGSAYDGKTLAYLAEMAEIASEANLPVSLQALPRAAHNGSLRALIREFIFQCYPPSGFNRRHLRAIANDIFVVLDGDIVELVSLFSSNDALVAQARSHAFRKLRNALALPQTFAAQRVGWLREIASRTFLMQLAGAAAFRFVLQQEGDRPAVWLPLLTALSRLFKRSDGKSAESSAGKDAATLILVLLLLSLLPLAGGYFGASRSVRSIENAPRDGRDGRDGQNGQNGKNGENGQSGQNGRDGRDGHDGKDCSDCKTDTGGTDQGGKGGKSSNPSSTSNSPSAIASVTIPNPSNTPENPGHPQTYPGGEVLVPLTPKDVSSASKSEVVRFSISYHDLNQPVAYTARLEAHGPKWPPDPLIMSVTKQDSPGPAQVAVTARKSYSDVLNADVWLEERHSKGWHNLWLGEDLVVVHILPRDAPGNAAPGPGTDKKP
jgi:hypothetical protein